MARLTTTYQQYKADTRLFVSWLVTTAEVNGWWVPYNMVPDEDGDGENHWQSAPTLAQPIYTVAIGDLVPIAKLVAIGNSAMPSRIANILERLIRLREAFARLPQQNGPLEPEYFTVKSQSPIVGILKQVQDILGGTSQDHGNTAASTPPTSLRDCLSTAFAAIHLYKPSQASLDAADIANLPAPMYDISEDDTYFEEDAQVAFAAMLQDVLHLREEVNNLWATGVRQTTLHLAAVAVATDTAIECARKIEEESETLLDYFGGAAKFLVDHYHAAASVEVLNQDGTAADGHSTTVDPYEISKSTMYQAYNLLECFRQACVWNPHMLPLYDGELYGWCNPDNAQESCSKQDKYTRDCAGFLEIVSEMAILDRYINSTSVQDEFTRGVRLIMADPSQPIPFWVIFTAQLFIDNLEILGGKFQDIYAEVTTIGMWTASRAKTALVELGRKPRGIKYDRQRDLERLRDEADFFEIKSISEWKLEILPSIGRPETVLMRYNAVYAGVWAHHLLTLFHTNAIAYANTWGAVFAMNQLNQAVTTLTGGETRAMWTDMRTMQQMQGRSCFWVGKAPEKLADFWKGWCLCQGVSLSDYDGSGGSFFVTADVAWSGRSVTGNATSTRSGLARRAPVSLSLGRLSKETISRARITLLLEDVGNIVGDLGWLTPDHSPGNVFEMVHECQTSTSADAEDDSQLPSVPEGYRNKSTVSPAVLIKTLATKLNAEMAELHFDYFRLHTKCWMMLDDFKQNMGRELGEATINGVDHVEWKTGRPQLVGIIFRAAAGLAPTRLENSNRKDLLRRARERLAVRLGNGEGSIVVDQMRKMGVAV